MDVSIQKKKDILNYLGVFLISQISFMKLFVPFVIGFIEKREEEIHKKLILYGISIITVILRFSFYEGIEYFINVLLILAIFEFIRQKDIDNKKYNVMALFTVTLLSSIVWQAFNDFVLYDLVTAVVVSSFTVVGYMFFENFDFDFEEIDEKNFLMITALIGILLSTFGNVKILNVNIRNIIAIYLVLSFAYIKNMKYAVLSGLIIGTISEIVNANMGTLIISLTLGGFIASIFRTKGKIATISGFLLGNTILAYYLIGYDLLIARFLEITFAGVLLLLTEKRLQNVNVIFVEPPLMLATASNNILDNFAETSNNLLNIRYEFS